MVDKTPVPAAIDPDKPLNEAARRRMVYQRRAAEQEKPSEASAFSKAFGMSISCMQRRAHAMQRHLGRDQQLWYPGIFQDVAASKGDATHARTCMGKWFENSRYAKICIGL